MTQQVQIRQTGQPWVQRVSAPSNRAHLLRAQLSAMQMRGEIREAFNWTEEGGQITVYVERLRTPPSPVAWYVAGAATTMSATVGAGIMLWQSRYIWLTLAVVALLVAGIVKLFAHDSAACVCLIHRH